MIIKLEQIYRVLIDFGGISALWEAEKLLAVCRKYQPEIIINNRTGIPQDVWTPEQRRPTEWRRDENGNLLGELIPIDFAKSAAGYGVKTYTAKTLEELEAALIDSKKQNVSTLIDIKVLPKTMTDGYGGWWNVGCSDVPRTEVGKASYNEKTEHLKNARKY